MMVMYNRMPYDAAKRNRTVPKPQQIAVYVVKLVYIGVQA